MSEALFPLDNVASYLAGSWPDIRREGESIKWNSESGVTVLDVQRVDWPTSDGLSISEVVTLSHKSPIFGSRDDSFLSVANRFATLSSLVPDRAGHGMQLVSKIGIFSQDREAAERVYAPNLAMQAVVIGWHAERIGRAEFQVDPSHFPFGNAEEPCPFDSADFEAVKSLAERRGFYASTEDSALSVEFPWDEGAVSNLFLMPEMQEQLRSEGHTEQEISQMAGRTGLFQLLSIRHPLYGGGIQARLEIPLFQQDENLASLSGDLNKWELGEPDLPPLLGSWCAGDRSVTFISFFPNQFCAPGLPMNLLIWNMTRHFRVREFVLTRSSGNGPL